MILGCDEVGYGALAGPVVAAAVACSDEWGLAPVKDSKKLSPKQRVELLEQFLPHVDWAVVYGSVEEINEHRIGVIRMRVMRDAIAQVRRQVGSTVPVIVDGNLEVPDTLAQKCVPRADDLYPVVSAASIVAKVFRDRFMQTLAPLFPYYYFYSNKGYGTGEHMRAIERYGPCPLHRIGYRIFK